MKPMLNLLCSAMLGSALLCVAPAFAAAETLNLTILGVGDVYNFEGLKTRGGFARLNAVAKAERAKGGNFLYLFDGDMFSPSLLSGFDKGANTIELTNVVPFDLAVPGNHEFDAGTQNFLARIANAKYPWAAINMSLADGSPVPGVGNKAIMKEFGKLKVGIVPVAGDTYSVVSSTGDWKFSDPIEAARAAAADIRKQGADIVIGLVQLNHTDDFKLYDGHVFDVILSGDDHDFINAYDGVSAYVETSTEAAFLTLVDLTVNIDEKDGKRSVKWEPNFRFIDTASVTPDPETQKLVDGYKDKLTQELSVVIGKTEGPLDSRRNVVRREESAMGNLIADAIRDATKADVAIVNGGGIRADKEYAAGADITAKDIFTELPFGNTTSAVEISGKAILEALENGFSMWEDGAGRFPQVSGMVINADLTKPAGSRVVSVMIGDKPLNPDAGYLVATNDYMVNGGDGYTMFKNGEVLMGGRDGTLLATNVIDYITKTGTVTEKVEGRIVLTKP
jgi:5'-nucleotidase / UDP-sugar diphosphatase